MRRLAAALLLAVSACSSLEPAAAVVDGVKIPEASLQEEVDRVRDDPSYRELLRQQGDKIRGVARRQVLTSFIRQTVIEHEASRSGIRVTATQIRSYIDDLTKQLGGSSRLDEVMRQQHLSRDRLRVLARRQVLEQSMQRLVSRDLRVDDAQVRAFYDANRAQFSEYHLLKIRVAGAADASKVADQARGGTDFARLAAERSKDASASKGGDAGFVDPQALGPSLASQLDAAAVGAIVGPVPVSDGFEVYKLLEKRARPPDQVRSRIVDQVLATQRAAAFERWLAERLGRAKIVVNPKYGTFDRATLTVVGAGARLPE